MKKRPLSSSAFSSKLVALLAVVVVGGLGSLLVTASHAATNHPPSGKFSPLTCTWDTTKNDYKYTIPASWSDADASKTDPANAYLGSSSSKANNPKTPDALDGSGHNGPSYTWNFYRSTLADSAWPVQLFVHDVGNAKAGIWTAEASVAKPTCPAPPSSGGGGPPVGSGSTNTGGGGSGGGSTNTKTGTGVSIPSVSPPANTADATVTAGTTSASLQIPADNATSLHLAYGTDSQVNNSTADQTLNNSTATVELESLAAKADYTYQIVRTNAGGTTTSAIANFTTKGYTISVKFTDAHGKAVSSLSGNLNDSRHSTAKSNKSGMMIFGNLDGGIYTLTVSYHGQQHTLDYDTTSVDNAANAAGTPVVLSDIIDVSRFTSVPVENSSGHSVVKIIGFVLLLGLLVAGIFLFVRRRKARATYKRLLGNSPTDAIDRHTAQHFQANPPPAVIAESPAAHTNESLREMVVKSMHEQALKKQQQPPTQPPVPPQP